MAILGAILLAGDVNPVVATVGGFEDELIEVHVGFKSVKPLLGYRHVGVGEVVKRVNASGADDEGDYEVVLQVSPQGAGSVEGAGMYDENDTAQIKATPAKGYRFVKWSDNVETAERNIAITDDMSLIAIFEKVDSTSSPTGGSGNGTEGSGSGTSGSGTSGSGTNSSNGSNTSPSTGSGTGTGETVKLSTYKNPSLGGSVTAGGTYDKGTQVTIEATPADGYLFDMWSDHVTDNPRTITLTANKSVTAWFYKEGEQKPSEMEDEETQL